MHKRGPTKWTLWSGAIVGGIVNAIMTAQSASYAPFREWFRNHYALNGADGREGVITFAGGHWYADGPLIGLFYDVHSKRGWPREQEVEPVFRGCPAYQRSLADQQALRTLRLEIDGQTVYRISTVFWDQEDCLAAIEPWEQVMANGASLICEELTEGCDSAISHFQEAYQMSPEQMAFAEMLFKRKIQRPPARIEPSESDVSWLQSTFHESRGIYQELEQETTEKQSSPAEVNIEQATAADHPQDSVDSHTAATRAMKCCRELFAELGIILPG